MKEPLPSFSEGKLVVRPFEKKLTCSKCLNDVHICHYCDDKHRTVHNEVLLDREHLHVTCCECRFTFLMEVAPQ